MASRNVSTSSDSSPALSALSSDLDKTFVKSGFADDFKHFLDESVSSTESDEDKLYLRKRQPIVSQQKIDSSNSVKSWLKKKVPSTSPATQKIKPLVTETETATETATKPSETLTQVTSVSKEITVETKPQNKTQVFQKQSSNAQRLSDESKSDDEDEISEEIEDDNEIRFPLQRALSNITEVTEGTSGTNETSDKSLMSNDEHYSEGFEEEDEGSDDEFDFEFENGDSEQDESVHDDEEEGVSNQSPDEADFESEDDTSSDDRENEEVGVDSDGQDIDSNEEKSVSDEFEQSEHLSIDKDSKFIPKPGEIPDSLPISVDVVKIQKAIETNKQSAPKVDKTETKTETILKEPIEIKESSIVSTNEYLKPIDLLVSNNVNQSETVSDITAKTPSIKSSNSRDLIRSKSEEIVPTKPSSLTLLKSSQISKNEPPKSANVSQTASVKSVTNNSINKSNILKSSPKSKNVPLIATSQTSPKHLSQTSSKTLSQSSPKHISQTPSKTLSQTSPKHVSQTPSKTLSQTSPKTSSVKHVSQMSSDNLPQTSLKHVSQMSSDNLSQTSLKNSTLTSSKTLSQTLPKTLSQTLPKHLSQTSSKTLSQTSSKTFTQPSSKTLSQTSPKRLSQTGNVSPLKPNKSDNSSPKSIISSKNLKTPPKEFENTVFARLSSAKPHVFNSNESIVTSLRQQESKIKSDLLLIQFQKLKRDHEHLELLMRGYENENIKLNDEVKKLKVNSRNAQTDLLKEKQKATFQMASLKEKVEQLESIKVEPKVSKVATQDLNLDTKKKRLVKLLKDTEISNGELKKTVETLTAENIALKKADDSNNILKLKINHLEKELALNQLKVTRLQKDNETSNKQLQFYQKLQSTSGTEGPLTSLENDIKQLFSELEKKDTITKETLKSLQDHHTALKQAYSQVVSKLESQNSQCGHVGYTTKNVACNTQFEKPHLKNVAIQCEEIHYKYEETSQNIEVDIEELFRCFKTPSWLESRLSSTETLNLIQSLESEKLRCKILEQKLADKTNENEIVSKENRTLKNVNQRLDQKLQNVLSGNTNDLYIFLVLEKKIEELEKMYDERDSELSNLRRQLQEFTPSHLTDELRRTREMLVDKNRQLEQVRTELDSLILLVHKLVNN